MVRQSTLWNGALIGADWRTGCAPMRCAINAPLGGKWSIGATTTAGIEWNGAGIGAKPLASFARGIVVVIGAATSNRSFWSL